MDLRNYLIDQGASIVPGDGYIKATAEQVLAYIADRGQCCKIDLSGVTVTDRLTINGLVFEDFCADNCDFEGGLEITNCEFLNSMNFYGTYIYMKFKLGQVQVEGNLCLPENLRELEAENIQISNLVVKGQIIFQDP